MLANDIEGGVGAASNIKKQRGYAQLIWLIHFHCRRPTQRINRLYESHCDNEK
jgi:hypothetical protein